MDSCNKCEPGQFANAEHTKCESCPPGKWNSDGIHCLLCDAGRYGDSKGHTHPNCTGPCEKGHYCPGITVFFFLFLTFCCLKSRFMSTDLVFIFFF